MRFKKWLKYQEYADYGSGLRRTQYMNPRFDPLRSSLRNVGERQEDPMKCTLHKCKPKKKTGDRIAAKFGFMKKK